MVSINSIQILKVHSVNKQCRTRSDDAFCGVLSGPVLFKRTLGLNGLENDIRTCSNGLNDVKLENTNDPLDFRKSLNLHLIIAELLVSMCTEFHLLLNKLRRIIFRYSIII